MAGLAMEMFLIFGISFFSTRYAVSFANLVVTPSGDYSAESRQTFTASICLQAGSQPKFTLEYVSVQGGNVLFVIKESQRGQQITDKSCKGSKYVYRYDLTYIDHPSLVGQSVKLRVTTQSPSSSAVSTGVITFTALYSLSGSTYATLGQKYIWTCDTSGNKTKGMPSLYICWYRGGYQLEQKVGCSSFQSGSCKTEDNVPPYKFGCTSNVFTLTIPGISMDESELKSVWRCANGLRQIYFTPQYTSPMRKLSLAIADQSSSMDASDTIDVTYPPRSDPVITGYDGSALQEGNGTVTVTCRQKGGNPVANMTFVCQGNVGTVNTSGNAVTSSHVLTINRALDRQDCTCTTSHSVGNYQRTVTKTFDVYYPPQGKPVITYTKLNYVSGSTASLSCSITEDGNPQATWIWRCGSRTFNSGITNSLGLSNLTFVVKTDNNQPCTCTASSSVGPYNQISDPVLLVISTPTNKDVGIIVAVASIIVFIATVFFVFLFFRKRNKSQGHRNRNEMTCEMTPNPSAVPNTHKSQCRNNKSASVGGIDN